MHEHCHEALKGLNIDLRVGKEWYDWGREEVSIFRAGYPSGHASHAWQVPSPHPNSFLLDQGEVQVCHCLKNLFLWSFFHLLKKISGTRNLLQENMLPCLEYLPAFSLLLARLKTILVFISIFNCCCVLIV